MKNLPQRIHKAIKETISSSLDYTPLHNPVFEGNEEKYLVDCVRSNFVSSVGEYVNRLEHMLADYTGAKRSVVTVNGTAALHVAMLLAGVKQGDEVLIPAMTFVATANAVSYTGAVPHFVDVDEKSLGIDPAKLKEYLTDIAEIRDEKCYNKRTGAHISAIVPMHTFGHPVDMDPLCEICRQFKIPVVEDAAESLGSFYKGKHTGNHGLVSSLSFNGNKIITTGGGGAILTNDDTLADRAKYITTTAKVPHKWEFYHDIAGFNYRMPALNAALGCAQMEQLDGFIENKRVLADNYIKAFHGIEGVSFFIEPSYAKSNYWLNTIILEKENESLRDQVLEYTNSNGIMTRPVWKLMNKLPMYSSCPSMDLTCSESLEKRIINIPSSAWLV